MIAVEEIVAPPAWEGSEGRLALVVRAAAPGAVPAGAAARFVTAPCEPLQAGALSYPAGHLVRPHRHCARPREVRFTQEALVVVKGRVRLDCYTSAGAPAGSAELGPGDMAVLLAGGHGLAALTDCLLYEVKGGPFGDDKVYLRGAG